MEQQSMALIQEDTCLKELTTSALYSFSHSKSFISCIGSIVELHSSKSVGTNV